MRCSRSFTRRCSALAAWALCAAAAAALEVPAGTEIEIRLKTKVGTSTSKAEDAVEAVVIAPVTVNGRVAIAAGSVVRGLVETVTPSANFEARALLSIEFREIEGGTRMPISARVVTVDNGREKVDEKGRIVGILASETVSVRLDEAIGKVAERYEGLAGILGAAKKVVLKEPEPEIAYDPGVELTLRLSEKLTVARPPAPARRPAVPAPAQLAALAAREPFQTTAQKPPKPSDITNLLFVGSEETLGQAFAAAGWSPAAALSARSKLETLRALAEDRGYKEAPMSVLLLEERPPDLVFQKQNNTLARRHHLRIWRRPELFRGRPVWVCAATHDTGISFNEQNRTFIHRIESEIDRERTKVVNDLLFTGLVKGVMLVDRPEVPRGAMNATGDKLSTDGRIAVLVLE